MRDSIRIRVRKAFEADLAAAPSITLRGGDAMDEYRHAPPFDAIEDRPDDAYIERHAYAALPYLDAASWRHYLPQLVDYAFRHRTGCKSMVVDGLIQSLRPPDREPPRLGSLSAEQEDAMREFLEDIALGEQSAHDREAAMEVLEEWWLPGARYRRRSS